MLDLFTKGKEKISISKKIHHYYDDHRNFYIAKHQFLLFKVHKVASTSLWITAAQLLGHEINSRAELLGDSLPTIPGHQLNNHPKVFKAGFIRNPWDRLLSCYLQKKMYKRNKFYKRNNLNPDMSFEAFVEAVCNIPDTEADKHFRSQYIVFTNHHGELLANFIGRFEHLQEDFDQLCKAAKLPDLTLPHWNKTPHQHYTDYYTPALAEAVAKRYEVDLQLFGYEYGQPLAEEARYQWHKTIPMEVKLKIAQYKSKKLLGVVNQLRREEMREVGLRGKLKRLIYGA